MHPNDDFVQTGIYNKVMTDVDRAHLVSNIVEHLGNAKIEIQKRQADHFYRVDPDCGARVEKCLGLDVAEIMKRAER